MLDKSEELEKQVADEAEIFEGTPAGLVLSKAAAELRAQREEIARLEKEKKIWSTLTEHKVRGKLLLMEQRAEKAEADRDHWEQQAGKNHKQTLEALRDLEGAKETIKSLQSPEIENELQNVVNALNAPTIAERKRIEEAMQENDRLRETGDHLLWAIGVSGMSPSVQKAVSKFKAALGEQDGS